MPGGNDIGSSSAKNLKPRKEDLLSLVKTRYEEMNSYYINEAGKS